MDCFLPLIMRSLWRKKRDTDELPISDFQLSNVETHGFQSEIGN
jgi:hypothetical protein